MPTAFTLRSLVAAVLFSAVAAWAQPASVNIVSGDGQSATVHTVAAQPLVVQVLDAGSAPVAGVEVTFSGAGLSFSAAGRVVVTDGSGNASVQVLPTQTGTLTASAAVAGVVTPATFTVTGTPYGVAPTRYVYWVDYFDSRIGRATFDGTSIPQWFDTVNANPYGLAVDANYIYWTDTGGYIGRVSLDGTSLVQPNWIDLKTLTGSTSVPLGLAIDGSHIYWGDNGLDAIGIADLDGGNVNPTWLSLGASALPYNVAVNATHVYWVDGTLQSVGRADLNGSNVPTNVTPNLVHFAGGVDMVDLALDATYLYMTDKTGGRIGRANLDGTGVNIDFMTGCTGARTVAVADAIYWASNTALGTAALDGTGNTTPWGTPDGSTYTAIAVSPANSTVITLASFTAQPQAGKVVVAWTTGSELATVGFNVYRAADPAGPYAKLNGTLIPAQGVDVAGASYTFQDTEVQAGQTWYYKLEDLDARGVATQHGPVSATLAAMPILSFLASPADLFLGGRTCLAWTVAGAPALTLNGAAVTGSSLWVAPAATTGYTLADGQGHQRLLTVTVKPFGFMDMAGLSLAWGSAKGDAAYNPCYDLDGDGKIDDADVALCFKGL